MNKYEITTLSVIVKPANEPIYCESATIIEIMDEAAGPFLEIRQINDDAENGTIRVCSEDWPTIEQAINLMIAECENQRRNLDIEEGKFK